MIKGDLGLFLFCCDSGFVSQILEMSYFPK